MSFPNNGSSLLPIPPVDPRPEAEGWLDGVATSDDEVDGNDPEGWAPGAGRMTRRRFAGSDMRFKLDRKLPCPPSLFSLLCFSAACFVRFFSRDDLLVCSG